jgi:hypothetical protein
VRGGVHEAEASVRSRDRALHTAARDPLDDLSPDPDVVMLERTNRSVRRWGKARKVALVDGDHVRFVERERHVELDQRVERLLRVTSVSDAQAPAIEQALARRDEELGENVLFRAEVAVEGRAGHPRSGSQVVDGDSVESTASEELRGAAQDLLPSPFPGRAGAGRGGRRHRATLTLAEACERSLTSWR